MQLEDEMDGNLGHLTPSIGALALVKPVFSYRAPCLLWCWTENALSFFPLLHGAIILNKKKKMNNPQSPVPFWCSSLNLPLCFSEEGKEQQPLRAGMPRAWDHDGIVYVDQINMIILRGRKHSCNHKKKKAHPSLTFNRQPPVFFVWHL